MKYHLDTNAVIAILNNRPATVRDRLRRIMADDDTSVAISPVVLFELWYGVERSQRRQQDAERLRVFLSGMVEVLAFESEDAALAGEIRGVLEAQGTPVGPYDVLIAAQALRAEATLVTANMSEFARVPGLVHEDWTAADT